MDSMVTVDKTKQDSVLAVLTNMGLLKAIRHTGVSLWMEALDRRLREKLETVESYNQK